MATKLSAPFTAYGRNPGSQSIFPVPYVTRRAPTVHDQGEIGQLWINQATDVTYVLTNFASGSNTWSLSPTLGVAAAAFTVNPGDLTVTAGNIDVLAGNITANVGVTTLATTSTGPLTVAGITNINTTNALATNIGRGGTGLLNLGNLTANTTIWGNNVLVSLGDAAGADQFS